MPYKGTLAKGLTIEIDVLGSPLDSTALAITKVNQRGGTNVRALTVGAGTSATFFEVLGARIVRMVIHVTPPAGGTAQIRVAQDTTQYTDSVTGDIELLFDAVL